MEFTAKALDAAKPRDRAYELHDSKVTGLQLRVERSGVKTLYFQYARGKKVRLGRYPLVSVGMARAECPRILQRIAEDTDPTPVWLKAAERSGVTIKEAATAYAKEFAALKRAQGFDARSLEVVNTIVGEVGEQRLEGFDVAAWMRRRIVAGNVARTVNRKLDAMRALTAYALRSRLIEADPCVGIGRLARGNVVRPRVRIPTDAQAAAIVAALDGDMRRSFLFARNTGLRRGELLRVRADDIVDGVLYVRTSKTGQGRTIPLNKTALDQLPAPFVWSKKRWSKVDAGFTWNEATRHAFVSSLLRRGVAPIVVAKLAGHGVEMSLGIYGHALEGDLSSAVDLLA